MMAQVDVDEDDADRDKWGNHDVGDPDEDAGGVAEVVDPRDRPGQRERTHVESVSSSRFDKGGHVSTSTPWVPQALIEPDTAASRGNSCVGHTGLDTLDLILTLSNQ